MGLSLQYWIKANIHDALISFEALTSIHFCAVTMTTYSLCYNPLHNV